MHYLSRGNAIVCLLTRAIFFHYTGVVKSNLSLFVVWALVIAAVAGIGGYLIGASKSSSSATPNVQQKPAIQLPFGKQETPMNTTATPIGPSSLIRQQQAVAIGMVVVRDGGSITLQAADKTEGTFKLGSTVIIYPLSASPDKPALGTTSKAAIQTNQYASVVLELVGNEYVVTSITYLKNLPPIRQ